MNSFSKSMTDVGPIVPEWARVFQVNDLMIIWLSEAMKFSQKVWYHTKLIHAILYSTYEGIRCPWEAIAAQNQEVSWAVIQASA